MRLHILSDLHLEHSNFEMPPVGSDVLVLAGDILTPGHRALGWAAQEAVHRGRAVVQVAGNHEFYGATLQAERALMREAASTHGIHLLDRTAVVLGGVRFLGCILWTDYRVPIIDMTGRGMRVDPAQGMAVAPRFASDWATCGFASALSDSFFEVPVLWIHGYTHTTFDYRVGNCRVVCNPRGYKLWGGDFEVDDFDPALVIEVKP